MIQKIINTKKRGLTIDGHGAGLDLDTLNAYVTAGITTDHECHTTQEVIDRLRRGMYVLMREGTAAKNLEELISAASIANSRRICFCTDDKHIDDLIAEGSIDHSIKVAVSHGLKPETAIQMGTLNAAECYKLDGYGAIAPGFIADFIILDDLDSFKIESVYKKGKCVVHQGVLAVEEEIASTPPLTLKNTVVLPNLTTDSFRILSNDKTTLNVIKIIPNKLETIHQSYQLKELGMLNEVQSNTAYDLLKVAVIERHHQTGNIGLGILQGLNLKKGALATTISHDSHNLIVCGTNDEDMLLAAKQLENMGGGIVVVCDGKILASLALEIGGLITGRQSSHVIEELEKLHEAIEFIAPNLDFNPFLTLSFLALPVIPAIKITDKGLFDVTTFNFTSVVS